MNNDEVAIVSAVRTPFGKFGGALKDFPSIHLGTIVIKEALERVKLAPEEVDETYYGLSLLAEASLEADVPARQATLLAGFPQEHISLTLNRACCSSLSALRLGYRAIKAGEISIAMAVGSDNMSRSPFLAPGIRWGSRLGNIVLKDPLFEIGYPGFPPLAKDAGEVALEYGVTRKDQDEWALQSHQRYFKALHEGKFKIGEELMAVKIPQKGGQHFLFTQDESPRSDTTMEKLSSLPVVYGSPTVTAGNAPGLSTGATAILLMSQKKAKEKGLTPLATILSSVATAMNSRYIAAIPAPTILKALDKANKELKEMDLIEINEAFAAMPLVSSKILSLDTGEEIKKLREKININGGAIAIGHPIGASALRITMTLIYELKRRQGGFGVAAICGGLAQGEGIVLKV
jgi:acetyl-CoA C-acetyltransferase